MQNFRGREFLKKNCTFCPIKKAFSLTSGAFWIFFFFFSKRWESTPSDFLFKKYIIEKTNEAEMISEERSEKAERSRENVWNEIQLKGP